MDQLFRTRPVPDGDIAWLPAHEFPLITLNLGITASVKCLHCEATLIRTRLSAVVVRIDNIPDPFVCSRLKPEALTN